MGWVSHTYLQEVEQLTTLSLRGDATVQEYMANIKVGAYAHMGALVEWFTTCQAYKTPLLCGVCKKARGLRFQRSSAPLHRRMPLQQLQAGPASPTCGAVLLVCLMQQCAVDPVLPGFGTHPTRLRGVYVNGMPGCVCVFCGVSLKYVWMCACV